MSNLESNLVSRSAPEMVYPLVTPVGPVTYVWHVKEYPEKRQQDDNRENNSKTIWHTSARLELRPTFIAWFVWPSLFGANLLASR